MGKLAVIFLLVFYTVFAEEELYNQTYQENSSQETTQPDPLKERWIDKYFLTERIFLYPILKEHAEDIGVTKEQLLTVEDFYRNNFPKMLSDAKQVKNDEDELHDLILHGGETKRIKELIIEIAKLKAELTAYNVKEVRLIQNILTDDQYETLLEYLDKNDND